MHTFKKRYISSTLWLFYLIMWKFQYLQPNLKSVHRRVGSSKCWTWEDINLNKVIRFSFIFNFDDGGERQIQIGKNFSRSSNASATFLWCDRAFNTLWFICQNAMFQCTQTWYHIFVNCRAENVHVVITTSCFLKVQINFAVLITEIN